VAGALGCVALAGRREGPSQVAAWALTRLAAVLGDVASSRSSSDACSARPGRRRLHRSCGSLRRCASGGLPSWALDEGALVLAHWPLPSGDRSRGVEDAMVLGVDPGRAAVGLRYIDGLEIEVPQAWVVAAADRRPVATVAAFRPSASCRAELTCELPGEPRRAAPQSAELCAAAPAPADATANPGEAEEREASDYPLLRLLQVAAPAEELAARVRQLIHRPRGDGAAAVSETLRCGLAAAPVAGQRACVDALLVLCAGGVEDAPVARAFANDILLSGCSRLPCTPRQLRLLEQSAALTDQQRAKLGVLGSVPRRQWHDRV